MSKFSSGLEDNCGRPRFVALNVMLYFAQTVYVIFKVQCRTGEIVIIMPKTISFVRFHL